MINDLWQDIRKTTADLKGALKEYRERGLKFATCEFEYRKKLSERLVVLRSQGQPVTHLADIARGEKEIAQLRLERDIAESLYKSAEEAINAYKLEIRVLESQLQREWGNAK